MLVSTGVGGFSVGVEDSVEEGIGEDSIEEGVCEDSAEEGVGDFGVGPSS